ncbi:MAG: TonB-dependent receptor [Prevotella sp.]|nr:TonB-dependent receptor [Prevotella sp.]
MGKTFLKCFVASATCKIALIAFMLFPAMSVLQAGTLVAKTVTGTVVSATDGEPLIGATVLVQGTQQGAVTDLDGNFSIEANEGQSLVISYIGFLSQTIKIGGASHYDVRLQEEANSLDDVVVIGYGTLKKKLVTGATVQVKGENIAKMNTTNPLQAMQGQTPGVNISSTSGQPGSDMKVQIRGLGTIGNSGPLYLIDGIGGDISTVNPADIESIDVLKDAASAAIYGAQAANGVVLITTKSGKEGKAVISFDGYMGWQNVARKAKMLNAKQYMEIMNEQAVNENAAPIDWYALGRDGMMKYPDIFDANGNINDTNWLDEMFKDNAITQSYNLGVTGGSATSNYAMTLGYTNQEGVVGGKDVSDYTRYNFRINSEHKVIKDLLKIGEQVSYIYTKNTGIAVGNQYNSTLRGAFNTAPILPIYGPNSVDGDPYYDTSTYGSNGWHEGAGNPYATMKNVYNRTKGSTFSGNVYAELTPFKGFKYRTVFGIVQGSNEYRYFSPIHQYSKYDTQHQVTEVSQNMNRSLGMTWTNTIQYDWTIKEHAFNALLGMESYRYEGTYVGANQKNLKEGFDTWPYAYVDNGSAATSGDGLGASGSPHGDSRSVSYFGRLGWNWKETYMINATLRRDGSSKFARGHRFGWFPSVSAGWTITNEKFMESTRSWLDFLKFRVSWGQVGNANISAFQYLAPVQNANTHYFFGSDLSSISNVLAQYWGAFPSRMANAGVTWETSEQTNIGIDARFFRQRLSLNFDYYIKTTKDWLVQAPIPATAGTNPPYINGGDVKNTGIEVALTWNDNIGPDFRYNVGFNLAYNKNKVGNIPTADGMIHGSTAVIYDNAPEIYRASNGEPIGYFWGFKTAGIFQNQQEINDWIAAGNGVLQADVQPGDVKFVDVYRDGVIDDKDKVNLGNGIPDVTMGFNLGCDYKGFDFSLVATGAFGHQIVQSYRNFTEIKANYTTRILDRWTGEGTSNSIPRVTEKNINWQFSDLFVQDADYLRISNITLGYDFARLLKQKWLSQARLYFQVQNAFTFTKYDGMDPEVGYGVDNWVSGIDIGYYPRPRTYLFGVNLKF